ncbi:MAG: hypothetical protein GF384_05945 [Elusimicrobia bacterium]|nr:hypothetical protein [Elusimicrobiota bacterium]MBD3412294.1 hypothetical protein [Elusimicrobiota bacterium]
MVSITTELKLINDGPGPAQLNMHKDAMLLAEGIPVLRFYTWDQKSFSIGYLQSVEEVKKKLGHADQNCPVVRRITGGGVVEHGNDLTFSLVLPYPLAWELGDVRSSYRVIHDMVLEIMNSINRENIGLWQINQKLSFSLCPDAYKPKANERKSYFCFEKPTQYDIMFKGIKIGGGAQRRTEGKFLHQGSLQVTMDPVAKDFLMRSFHDRLKNFLKLTPLIAQK